MGDPAGMTIEFLRARLLSERSVSRTARQRADELAKRVVELEEQLKLVSLQKNKAEKATAEVLSILDNHGISEFSEEFDSSSDQELTHCESKVGNNFPNEEERSMSSKTRRNHMDEFSGSDLESSCLPGRSLSWKSGKDSSHSHEKKHVDSSTRRQHTFAFTTSASLKRRVGKSCRQIRRRETRSAVEESQNDSSMLSCQDNGGTCSEGATCSEGSTFSDIGPEIFRESSEKQDSKILLEGPLSGDFENQRPVTNASNYLNIHGSNKDMERALEHQAELIGQYEEEEKAQREWEEKFRENNNSTQDSFEPGKCSDTTEEGDGTKADQGTKLTVEDVPVTKESSKSQSDGFQPPPQDMLAYESRTSDFVFPVATEKQDRHHSGNYNVPPSHGYCHGSHPESPASNQSTHIVPSHASSCKENTLGSNNDRYALVKHETPNKLGSVLEALHHAKLSLKHKLNTVPSIDAGSVRKAIEFSVGNSPEVPVGFAGLFRVPSDFHFEPTTKTNVLGSNSQLSLTNYYPHTGSALTAGDRFITSPYESRSSVSTSDRHLTIPMSLQMDRSWEPPETWSRFPSHKPLFGPSFDMGLPFSSRYTYNDQNKDPSVASSSAYTSATYPFYPDLTPQMPTDEGLRRSSSGRLEVPPADHFSFYSNHLRPPNVYRF